MDAGHTRHSEGWKATSNEVTGREHAACLALGCITCLTTVIGNFVGLDLGWGDYGHDHNQRVSLIGSQYVCMWEKLIWTMPYGSNIVDIFGFEMPNPRSGRVGKLSTIDFNSGGAATDQGTSRKPYLAWGVLVLDELG